MVTYQIVFLVVCSVLMVTHASVIRKSEGRDKMEVTTLKEQVVTTEQPDITTTVLPETETETDAGTVSEIAALTKDEEASILLFDQSLLESSSSDLRRFDAESYHVQRSGKLLLLNSPKLGEKSKVPEEPFEESDELKEDEDELTTTEAAIEVTTIDDIHNEEEKKVETATDSLPEEVPTTKLFPINDTLYEDNRKTDTKDEAQTPVIVSEEPTEIKSSNLAAFVLEEDEHDYVLVESDLVEAGPYADIDSELHLQPIVQSVEIVPSSVDDRLLVNYVHSW